MRYTAASLLLLLSLLSDNAHAVVFPRAQAGPGYLSIPVNSIPRTNRLKNQAAVRRRDGKAVNTELENQDFFYSAKVGIGNPPQSVTILLDTGSSELWVNPDCDNVQTQLQHDECVSFGSYDPSKSKDAQGPFGHEQLNYGDASDQSTQTTVDIRYYADDITIGGATLKNQTFGRVTQSEAVAQGIMGLGPDLDGGFQGEKPYSLLLNTMADQGIIPSKVFSLDLRHADDTSGAVVYGGLDKNRFIGSLQKQDLVRGTQGEFRLATTITTLGLTAGGQSQSFDLTREDQTVLLDSGTTISRMHESVAFPILEALRAEPDGQGNFATNCTNKDAGGSLDVGFGDKVIRVPFKDFVVDPAAGTGETAPYCFIGLVTTGDLQILGDTILRAGYFVFDWDNEQVHVAQAATCGKGSDIVTVGTGKDAVPSEKGNCQEAEATSTGSSPTVTSVSISLATSASLSLPTEAQTTTYMVSTCLPFELGCQEGVMTTQTVDPAVDATTTGGGDQVTTTGEGGQATGSSGSGNNADSAGGRRSVGWGVVGGALAVGVLGLW